MNRKTVFDAITNIREDIVEEAGVHKFRKKPKVWLSAIAAVLAVCIGFAAVKPGEVPTLSAYAVSEAVYPEAAPYPDESAYIGANGIFDSYGFNKVHQKWNEERKARLKHDGYSDGLANLFSTGTEAILTGSGETNPVCSPVSVYMALAMTAELTGGSSRQQILDALGERDLAALREQANTLWNANYSNDGALTTILASSLWLNDQIGYNADTMKTLSETYYTSAFQGTMGDEAYTQRLRDWMNEQTVGLLAEQANTQELDSETVMSLVTTVFFQGKWLKEFLPDKTASGDFHTPSGDATADFMHSSGTDDYYWADHFGAVSLPMEGGAAMWLLLPDEGVTPEELLSDPQTMQFILAGNGWENQKTLTVNLAVPKFDVTCRLDLSEGLQKLGITEVFDENAADFSAMCEERVFLSSVPHAARVAIDEEGCTAAAFTMMRYYGAMMPPEEHVDFVLDRPFVFAVTSADGLPLFVGIVNEP